MDLRRVQAAFGEGESPVEEVDQRPSQDHAVFPPLQGPAVVGTAQEVVGRDVEKIGKRLQCQRRNIDVSVFDLLIMCLRTFQNFCHFYLFEMFFLPEFF